jgi:preprotein translocase SecE subunit
VARNRERAKQRQAERKAARQSGSVDAGAVPEVEARASAPREDLGFPDRTLDAPPDLLQDPDLQDDLDFDDDYVESEIAAGEDEASDGEPPSGPRGIRGGDRAPAPGEPAEHHGRGRVIGFLIASWAELQRVQWPNRSQLTSLTGITLAFVLLVGGYLGLLDAIFSRLIRAIL